LHENDVERGIDIIELLFQSIDSFVRTQRNFFARQTLSPDEAIADLNARFRENGIGFEYAAGQIIRVDSHVIHQDVVKPVLRLLENAKYKGANEEFLSAHARYREGKYKECLNDSLKAFESTLKVICHKRGWAFKATDMLC